jgi:hypothetical protein
LKSSLKPSIRSKLELLALIGGFIMISSELWRHYEADKRIQEFSPNTLRAYALQLKMLVTDLGDVEISEITLNLLKE